MVAIGDTALSGEVRDIERSDIAEPGTVVFEEEPAAAFVGSLTEGSGRHSKFDC